MGERFSRLFMLDEETYAIESPVLIAAGVLLKDSVTDSIVVQLKLQNLSAQTVVAAKVKLCAYDVAGSKIPGVDDYQYLDLNTHTGECWGDDKAIILPEAETRSFSIEKISVLFTDSNTWETTDFTSPISLPKAVLLERELPTPELVSEYRMAVNQEAKFAPALYGKVWRCSCGAINRNETCHSCHATKSVVFSEFNVPALSEKVKECLARQQIEEVERKARRQKQTRVFKRAAAVAAPVILLGLIFVLWIVPYVIEPYSMYSNAQALVEAGQFNEAIKIFEGLGNFRDAQDRANSIKNEEQDKVYLQGLQYIESESYTTAYELWQSTLTPERFDQAVQEVEGLCNEWLASGKYDAAGELIKVFGFEDSELQLKLWYLLAKQALSLDDLNAAHKFFIAADGYSDSDEYLNKFGHTLSEYGGWIVNYNYTDDGVLCGVELTTSYDKIHKYIFTVENGYLTKMRNEGQGFWYEYLISYSDYEIIIEEVDAYKETGYRAYKYDITDAENGNYVCTEIFETSHGLNEINRTVQCSFDRCGIVCAVSMNYNDGSSMVQECGYSLDYGETASNNRLPYQEIIFLNTF